MRLERHQRFYFRMSTESDERRFFKRRRRKKEFGIDGEKGLTLRQTFSLFHSVMFVNDLKHFIWVSMRRQQQQRQ